MGIRCSKMVNFKNLTFNIPLETYQALNDDEINFLINTEFINELKKNFKDIQTIIDEIKANEYESIVLIGFGGSSLGTKAIYDALPKNKDSLNIYFIDELNNKIKNFIKEKSLYLFISKSGNTNEVLSIFNFFSESLKETKNFFFITQEKDSILNQISIEKNIKVFNVNENLGGRFSVISPSTFLPLGFANYNWKKIQDGAINFLSSEENNNFNITSSLLNFYLNNYRNGRNITCIMPYHSNLNSLAEWMMQLIAESTGKKNLGGYPLGITPVKYSGPKDEHSQMQLLLDGPPDKTLLFLISSEDKKDFFSDLILEHQKATAGALNERNVPNIEITINNINEESLGALFLLFQISISLLGPKLNINPFDQPGVELIKKRLKSI